MLRCIIMWVYQGMEEGSRGLSPTGERREREKICNSVLNEVNPWGRGNEVYKSRSDCFLEQDTSPFRG